MDDAFDTLKQWVDESERIAFFGGAGVSTESGIPDFRGVDGLYRQKYAYPPETILSREFFEHNPEEFYRFYREKILILDAEPNPAHRKLAEWEAEGRLNGVVTQNIDGLHQKAGSKRVFELHGSIHRNFCTRCGKSYSAEWVASTNGVPKCACGGIVKPDVVLYGESLDDAVMRGAMHAIAHADLLIVGGTSLSVYPAAGLIDWYAGSRLVLVNRTPTPRDGRANLILRDPIGQVFQRL
ncbi:MAG TPA: NAD-dependent protein deacylase [Candidatus Faecivicinus avistercoris]|nr:NAD-dependent protein deacylase [Candidatus Faecivicinus avistercoris]